MRSDWWSIASNWLSSCAINLFFETGYQDLLQVFSIGLNQFKRLLTVEQKEPFERC